MRLTLILALGINLSVFGQSLSGTYIGAKDTLEFERESVRFRILSNGGSPVEVAGKGTYSLIGEYLVIRTGTAENARDYQSPVTLLSDKTLIYYLFRPAGLRLELILLGWVANDSFRGKRTLRVLRRDSRKYRYEKRVLSISEIEHYP